MNESKAHNKNNTLAAKPNPSSSISTTARVRGESTLLVQEGRKKEKKKKKKDTVISRILGKQGLASSGASSLQTPD